MSDIEVSKLSLAELSDIASHIDRVKFPERAAVIDEELARRRQLPSKLRVADLARSGRMASSWLPVNRSPIEARV